MAQLYGGTTLPGSLPALFHDIKFIYFYRFAFQNPNLRDYSVHLSVVGTPVYTENQKNGADSKKRCFVNSIQECLFSGQIQSNFFI